MCAVTAAEFTAEGTGNILMNRFITLSRGAHQLYYQTTESNSALSLRHPSTHLSVYTNSRQVPTIRVVAAASNVSITPWRNCYPWSATSTNLTGMNTFPKTNTPTINPLARRQASLPMKCISDAYPAPPSPSSIATMVEPIRASTATTSPITTLHVNGNSVPRSS